MEARRNELGQPVGPPVANWTAPSRPAREPLQGRLCRVEPLDARRHAPGLYEADSLDQDGKTYTYLPYGPFRDFEAHRSWLTAAAEQDDAVFFAICDGAGDRPAGVASYLRIEAKSGSIEVGHIHLSPRLQRSAAATEAMYLMMRRAFELGYRRYEWKCDALNESSRAAALRLGFSFEGVFRQATVYKARSRDTAWYSVIDSEWPALRGAFEAWLAPDNFDERGQQRSRLSAATMAALRRGGASRADP